MIQFRRTLAMAVTAGVVSLTGGDKPPKITDPRPILSSPQLYPASATEHYLTHEVFDYIRPGFNIRVNSVAPGSIMFEGGSWWKRQQDDPKGIAEFIRTELPFGRFGTKEEVGAAVAFLASDAARYTTGHILWVDGGVRHGIFRESVQALVDEQGAARG